MRSAGLAGAPPTAAPPLVVGAFLMDYCVAGLGAGATKGWNWGEPRSPSHPAFRLVMPLRRTSSADDARC